MTAATMVEGAFVSGLSSHFGGMFWKICQLLTKIEKEESTRYYLVKIGFGNISVNPFAIG